MSVYRVNVVEVVRRSATIEIPDGSDVEDPLVRRAVEDAAREIAVEIDAGEAQIEILPALVPRSIDCRLT
ncbi:hypothetical protein [Gordonia liuliyuniae]|uniref:Uncharacterized protein n=1 Tax=Gordonia liuliyuniae TaxID=2911517 RepID=A0ABS9IYA9_9ACTN|nr:hypothetical protein [Gordonia liuliyuniae]MCF8590442.1 hypothetical protein [Gordonia liuliyuniae]